MLRSISESEREVNENGMRIIELNLYVCEYCHTVSAFLEKLRADQDHLLLYCSSNACAGQNRRFKPLAIDFARKRFVTLVK